MLLNIKCCQSNHLAAAHALRHIRLAGKNMEEKKQSSDFIFSLKEDFVCVTLVIFMQVSQKESKSFYKIL